MKNIDKSDFIKFLFLEDTIKKTKRQEETNLQHIYQIKDMCPEYTKNSYNSIIRQYMSHNNKKCVKDLKISFTKKETNGQ